MRPSPMRHACCIALTAVLAVCFVASCTPDSEWYGTTRPKHPPDELWVNNNSEPEWIDPGKCSDAIGGTIITNTFEGLLSPDPATMSPVPGVAEKWDVSSEGFVYTFHLREDARWSDGKPVTAEDFRWSWTRVIDAETGSKYAEEMFAIRNGDAYNQHAIVADVPDAAAAEKLFAPFGKVEKTRAAGPLDRPFFKGVLVWMETAEARTKALAAVPQAKLAGPEVLGMRVIDDRTFEVTLQDAIPYFLPKITTLYTFYPVPRRVLEKLASEGKNPDLWTRPEHFVSNGPYVLTEWKFRQQMVFEKNPLYWGRDAIRIRKVIVRMIDANLTALQMYKAGETDFSGENVNLPAEYAPMLRKKKDYAIAPWLAIYFYWVNVEAKGVDDRQIRRALNMAIDKQALVDHVTRQSQIPATSLIKGGLGGYQQLPGDAFDPEVARKILADAGFPGGKGLPPISITINTNETHRSVAEAIQEMWRKNLGIDAQISNQEWQVFLRDLNEKKFQVARLGWIGDYPDPYTFLSIFTSDSGNNRSNWKNKEFDGLLEASNRETDPAKRLALMRDAEALVMRDLPMIPLYWYTRARLVKPYVRGIDSNFLDRHPWKAVWIDTSAP